MRNATARTTRVSIRPDRSAPPLDPGDVSRRIAAYVQAGLPFPAVLARPDIDRVRPLVGLAPVYAYLAQQMGGAAERIENVELTLVEQCETCAVAQRVHNDDGIDLPESDLCPGAFEGEFPLAVLVTTQFEVGEP